MRRACGPSGLEEVVVTPDNLPQATIVAPAKDVALPPDGHLEIEGSASDGCTANATAIVRAN